ncbi:hypothetical protein V6N13_059103 [Hibiscus sabdariffa]
MKCFEVRWADVVASGLEEVARVEAELGLTSDQVNEGYNLDMGLETSKIRPSIDNWADEDYAPKEVARFQENYPYSMISHFHHAHEKPTIEAKAISSM